MAQRTQMRLHAITGSLSAINSGIADADVAPVGSSAAFAENMLEAMGHIAGAIKRIHGNSDFLAGERGKFTHATSQFIGVLSASSDLRVGGDVEIDKLGGAATSGSLLHIGQDGILRTDANLKWDGEKLTVNGALDLSGGIIGSSLTPGQVVYVDPDGALTTESGFDYDEANDVLGVSGSIKVGGGYGADGIDLKANGDIDMDGRLLVDGEALVSGSLKVAEDLFVVDGASGNITTAGDLAVNGGDLTSTAGSFNLLNQPTSIVFGSEATSIQIGKDAGSLVTVKNDLTVEGNLYVQGSTTTVDSEVVTIEDVAIVLGASGSDGVPTSDSFINTAGGAGLIVSSSDGNHTFLWSSNAWNLNDDLLPTTQGTLDLGSDAKRWGGLYLSGAASVKGGLQVADSLFTVADDSGNTYVAGTLDVDGQVTLGSLNVEDLAETRVVFAGAAGELVDDADFTFATGSNTLRVNGYVTSSIRLQSYSVVAENNLTLKDQGGNVDQIKLYAYDAQTAHMDVPLSQFNINAGTTVITATTGLHLLSNSTIELSGSSLRFVDGNQNASTAVNYQFGVPLASSADDWSNFETTFGASASILSALTSGGAGGKFIEAVTYTGTIVSGTLLDAANDVVSGTKFGGFGGKWGTIVEPRILKTDVFVNGQLMVSGSGMDYLIDGAGNITFSFNLVPDDMVVVKVG